MIQRVYVKNREEAIAWICVNQLGRPHITEEMRRYLIGKRCEIEKYLAPIMPPEQINTQKKDFKANILPELAFDASASRTRERLSKEYSISQASILNYEKYTQALDFLTKIVPDLVPRLLTSEIKISLENAIAFSQLSVPEIRGLSQSLSDNPKEFILNLRQTLLKKQNSTEKGTLPIPVGSIKEMPAYDPDAEISSLALTIPSWISSINRTRSASQCNDVTDKACRKLEKELAELKETINNMLAALKEVN